MRLQFRLGGDHVATAQQQAEVYGLLRERRGGQFPAAGWWRHRLPVGRAQIGTGMCLAVQGGKERQPSGVRLARRRSVSPRLQAATRRSAFFGRENARGAGGGQLACTVSEDHVRRYASLAPPGGQRQLQCQRACIAGRSVRARSPHDGSPAAKPGRSSRKALQGRRETGERRGESCGVGLPILPRLIVDKSDLEASAIRLSA